MATQRTYVIISITHVDDLATVVGTVDGVQVTIQCNFSAIAKQPSVASVWAMLSPLLLNAAIPSSPIAVNLYNGSFIQ